MAFSPDGRTVVTINTSLEMWDVADRAHPRRLAYTRGRHRHRGGPGVLPGRARPGHRRRRGRDLVERGRPGTARQDRGPAGSRRGRRGRAVQFSPDGRILASSYGGTVALWNIADPARATRIATLTRQDGDVSALSFSPDGHLLASASERGTVALWNIADPARATPLATLTIPPPA